MGSSVLFVIHLGFFKIQVAAFEKPGEEADGSLGREYCTLNSGALSGQDEAELISALVCLAFPFIVTLAQ